MSYRIKQLLWAILANFKELDYNYVEKLLSKKEFDLFKKLKKGEQNHCINVSKDCVKLAKENSIESNEMLKKFARLGLLHDIGKLDYPINIFTKSILVIGKNICKNNMIRLQNIKAVDIYCNHGERAFKFLDEDEYEIEFVDAIKKHHYDKEGNIFLKILKLADDMN